MADEVFRHDGYMAVFEAGVVSVNGDEVILDCTAFYPGGGGQVCDTGKINGFRVTDVHYNGKEIVHVVPGNDLRPGLRIWGEVDWERRFDLMMGHTGEHLLFCALHRQDPELTITKIYIGPDEKYVIVNHDISWEKIGAALEFANQAIRDNLPVRKTVMSRDDPDLEKVRIKLDRIEEDEEITVVSIGDIDYSACSGIHVMETSELGMLFVDRKVSAGKDGIAIHFKVGNAAQSSAMRLANICLQAVEEANSKPEDIVRSIANMKHDLAVAAEASKAMVKQQIKNEIFGEKRLAIEVFPKQKNLVDVQDVYHLWVFPKDFDLPFGIHPIRDKQCKVISRGCPKDVGYLIENTRQMSSTVSDRERRNQADTEVFDGQRVSHPQEKET